MAERHLSHAILSPRKQGQGGLSAPPLLSPSPSLSSPVRVLLTVPGARTRLHSPSPLLRPAGGPTPPQTAFERRARPGAVLCL